MTASPEPPLHISSFIVRCRPERLSAVIDACSALPGVEVHGRDHRGKFIALLERETDADLVATIGQLERLPGVLNASLVYHHAE